MIFVARLDCPASLDLADPASAASKELAAAKLHLDENDEAPPASMFKVYAKEDVRDRLGNMFAGKCAYCECATMAGNDSDIEHYRPKGGVTEAGDTHPGYWWLAMNWSNLVLSCAHCNQERRQLGLDPAMSEAEIRAAIADNDRRTTGKKNAFPTEDGNYVTLHSDDVSIEKPLLIDPTITDPEPLFDWVVSGPYSSIVARNGDARADRTWRVLGLNRRRLTESRGQMLDTLTLLAKQVRDAVEEARNASTDAEARLAMRLARNGVDVLRTHCLPTKPYSALARSYLRQVEAMIAAIL